MTAPAQHASETPRTDALCPSRDTCNRQSCALSRRLERELAVAEGALQSVSQIDFHMAATNGCAFTAVKTALDALATLAAIRKS